MNQPSPEITDAQHLIQQGLGRCLLRIQQYEKLLKRVVAHISVEGSVEAILKLQQDKVDAVQNKTLGQLIRVLTDGYLAASEPAEVDEPPTDQASWVRFQSRMLLSEERYQKTKSALSELVSLRNLLVHHFIDRFDLWSLDGCREAQAFLQESFELVAGHHLELIEWATSMDEARHQLHSAALDFLDGYDHTL